MITPAQFSEEWELEAPAVKTAFNGHAGGSLQRFFGHMALFVRPVLC
jgi:hypothetical protein